MKKGEGLHPSVDSEDVPVPASPDLTPNIITNATTKHIVLTGNNTLKFLPESVIIVFFYAFAANNNIQQEIGIFCF